ncbi:MAG: DUF134 domain-containing protein [Kiritimatiellae bacterium]|nr:DUF134 domain-containing protein [Kiritimatiellia bacterium]
MPRPCCLRRIGFRPCANFFKPTGIPFHALEQVTLALDEVEALRLADLNGLYQEQAAKQMKISRPTFARIVEAARRKVADALTHGKALRLEGGAVTTKGEKKMPGRDGTRPIGGGRRLGLGPCGRGQRCGWKDANGSGFGQRGMGRTPTDTPLPTANETKIKTETEKGKHES